MQQPTNSTLIMSGSTTDCEDHTLRDSGDAGNGSCILKRLEQLASGRNLKFTAEFNCVLRVTYIILFHLFA